MGNLILFLNGVLMTKLAEMMKVGIITVAFGLDE